MTGIEFLLNSTLYLLRKVIVLNNNNLTSMKNKNEQPSLVFNHDND